MQNQTTIQAQSSAPQLPTIIRKEWTEKGYGGLKERILCNPDGSQSNILAVEKHGRLINCMSTAYHVLPNLDVEELIAPLIDKMDLVPFRGKNTSAEWAQYSKKGVVYDQNETEMLASFMFAEKFDITGKKDMVQCGVTLRNSEAGKYAFSISPFTYRNSCDNRMYHLAHESILGGTIVARDEALSAQAQRIKEAKEDYKQVIRGFKKRHSRSLKLDLIEPALMQVKLGAENVINRYKEMFEMKLLKKQAELIGKRFPKYVVDDLAWLKVTPEDKKKGTPAQYDFDGDAPNTWDAFNDMTKSLTHNGKNFNSTVWQYKAVDQIIVQQRNGRRLITA